MVIEDRDLLTDGAERINALRRLMDSCVLCPRHCRARRFHAETGFCGVGGELTISSWGRHQGEESVLVGTAGSGTIFLTGCNLGCLFCQNYDISIRRQGQPIGVVRMVEIILALQSRGCVNINFVTPTHQSPLILEAIIEARRSGLTLPVVYNCGGYETVELLSLLNGYIDIYMPDIKFFDPDLARQLTGRADYPDIVRAAVKEMHRQVGDLKIERGLARRGLLVRHLVMPGAVEDSNRIVDFLADDISGSTYVNVMAQYQPCYRAATIPQIARPTSVDEWQQVRDHAHRRGLRLAER